MNSETLNLQALPQSSAPVSVDLKMIKRVGTESGVEVERNLHPGISVTPRKNQNKCSLATFQTMLCICKLNLR